MELSRLFSQTVGSPQAYALVRSLRQLAYLRRKTASAKLAREPEATA